LASRRGGDGAGQSHVYDPVEARKAA